MPGDIIKRPLELLHRALRSLIKYRQPSERVIKDVFVVEALDRVAESTGAFDVARPHYSLGMETGPFGKQPVFTSERPGTWRVLGLLGEDRFT